MIRKEGYYWVKVTEKVSDNGGPDSDQWVIEYWDGSNWDCYYGSDDFCFHEINNEAIKEPN